MSNAKRTVTVTVSADTSYLGDAATDEDVQRWARNVCAEIESRFGVRTRLVIESCSPSSQCSDEEIDAWLRDISGTDEWTQYL